MMRHYEVVAVIHPEQQGRVTAMIAVYKKIVTDGGGVLHRLEDWGRRPLAYPIQNQHKAQYVLMNIECGSETLDKLRETFRFSDSVMRSLIMRREAAITEPSVMMKATEDKEGEGEDPHGRPQDPPKADTPEDGDEESEAKPDDESASEEPEAKPEDESSEDSAAPAADSEPQDDKGESKQ